VIEPGAGSPSAAIAAEASATTTMDASVTTKINASAKEVRLDRARSGWDSRMKKLQQSPQVNIMTL